MAQSRSKVGPERDFLLQKAVGELPPGRAGLDLGPGGAGIDFKNRIHGPEVEDDIVLRDRAGIDVAPVLAGQWPGNGRAMAGQWWSSRHGGQAWRRRSENAPPPGPGSSPPRRPRSYRGPPPALSGSDGRPPPRQASRVSSAAFHRPIFIGLFSSNAGPGLSSCKACPEGPRRLSPTR